MMYHIIPVFTALILFMISQVHCTDEHGIALRRGESVFFEQDSFWLEKRQTDLIRGGHSKANLPTFHWPEIDGPSNDSLKLLHGKTLKWVYAGKVLMSKTRTDCYFPLLLQSYRSGYWTFNATFDDRLQRIAKKNLRKAQKILFDESVRKAFKWRDACWKYSNATAKAHNRTDTLARVIVFPFDDKEHKIDHGKGIASPIKFGCFERAKNGDYNVAIVNHTIKLLKRKRWDKQSALRQIKKRIRDDKRSKSMKKTKQSPKTTK